MNDLDAMERMLADLRAAEGSGVFRSTPRPAGTGLLLRIDRPRRATMYRIGIAILPIAACLTAAIGLQWLPGIANQTTPGVNRTAPMAADSCLLDPGARVLALATFRDCVTGPARGFVDPECTCADLDKDGDVDLLDYGTLQRLMPTP